MLIQMPNKLARNKEICNLTFNANSTLEGKKSCQAVDFRLIFRNI